MKALVLVEQFESLRTGPVYGFLNDPKETLTNSFRSIDFKWQHCQQWVTPRTIGDFFGSECLLFPLPKVHTSIVGTVLLNPQLCYKDKTEIPGKGGHCIKKKQLKSQSHTTRLCDREDLGS